VLSNNLPDNRPNAGNTSSKQQSSAIAQTQSRANERNQFLGARTSQAEIENAIINGDTRQYNRNDPTIRSDRSRDSIANPNLSMEDFRDHIQRLSQQLGRHESLRSHNQRQAIDQITTTIQRTSFWQASSENDFESDIGTTQSYTAQERTGNVAQTTNHILSLRNRLFSPTPHIPDSVRSHLSPRSSSEAIFEVNNVFRSIDDGIRLPGQKKPIEISGLSVQRESLIIDLHNNIDDAQERFLEFVIMQASGEAAINRLTCPITYGIYQEPIEASDGHIYEKTHLLRYIEREEVLYPNKKLISPFRIPMTRKLVNRPDISREINEFICAINDGRYNDFLYDFHQRDQSEYQSLCF
tara:strand:+ start:1072 stop:2133 length:1062 start_codon:yes stop_codon:yes gene_type:complete